MPNFNKNKPYKYCPTPPPSGLIHILEINNIHNTECFLSTCDDIPPSQHLSTIEDPPPYPQNMDKGPAIKKFMLLVVIIGARDIFRNFLIL